jgi:hypothetical protein
MNAEPLMTDEYIEIINDLLPKASAVGGYCIGMVAAAAWQDGLTPTRELLEGAALCPGPQAAVDLFAEWKASR